MIEGATLIKSLTQVRSSFIDVVLPLLCYSSYAFGTSVTVVEIIYLSLSMYTTAVKLPTH